MRRAVGHSGSGKRLLSSLVLAAMLGTACSERIGPAIPAGAPAIGAGIELIVSILKFRAPGMTVARMPIYAWSILVMGFMLLFGFTPLLVATTFLELDRKHGTHFFNPEAGGNPLLWQHLFWIFGHPDVYIQFIPAAGMIAMIIPTFARRPNVGHTMIALAMVAIGFLSFGLWVHHMFATGISALALSFFAAASMSIAIPSGIQIFAWIATIWGGRPRFATPFLFALGFIAVFVLGGLSGVMVAAVPFNLQVHDSYFVVAHFHYVLVGGVLFPIFAALHYWLPGMTGKMLSETLGKWTFWLIFVGFNVAFFPMHLTGLLGMPRRYYTYPPDLGWNELNLVSTLGTYVLGLGVLVFLWNFVHNILLCQGRDAGRNPWSAGTLDWATPLPPPDEGYRTIPIVRSRYPLWEQDRLDTADERTVRIVRGLERTPATWRGTLITSVLTAEPQGIIRLSGPSWWPFVAGTLLTVVFVGELFDNYPLLLGALLGAIVAWTVWLWPNGEERELPETDADGTIHGLPVYLNGSQAPAWWSMALIVTVLSVFLACLLFGYFYLRTGTAVWPPPGVDPPSLLLPGLATLILLASAGPAVLARHGARRGHRGSLLAGLAGSFGLGLLFLGVQVYDWALVPFTHTSHAYGSAFFTIVGFHLVAALGGLYLFAIVQAQAWLGQFTARRHLAVETTTMYWLFVVASWLPVLAVAYLYPHVA